MKYVEGKRFLTAYANYRAYHNGRPLKVIAREEGISVEAVKQRLLRIDNYKIDGKLNAKLYEAKQSVGWCIGPEEPKKEKLPVRGPGGCRFSPLP